MKERGRKKPSDARAISHQLPQAERVMPSHFWSNTTSPQILSPPFSLLTMTLHAWNAEFESAIQVVTPSNSCPPWPITEGTE